MRGELCVLFIQRRVTGACTSLAANIAVQVCDTFKASQDRGQYERLGLCAGGGCQESLAKPGTL